MVKALADRLAEAFAEHLHHERAPRVGYAPDETLTREELIGERYRGIRPAFGYPACPDHSEKRTLFDAARAPSVPGIELTESCAMTPGRERQRPVLRRTRRRGTSPSGGIGRDQVEDYAQRAGRERRGGRALAPPEPRVRAVAERAHDQAGARAAVPNIPHMSCLDTARKAVVEIGTWW